MLVQFDFFTSLKNLVNIDSLKETNPNLNDAQIYLMLIKLNCMNPEMARYFLSISCEASLMFMSFGKESLTFNFYDGSIITMNKRIDLV
jgi:hypothetical protein